MTIVAMDGIKPMILPSVAPFRDTITEPMIVITLTWTKVEATTEI